MKLVSLVSLGFLLVACSGGSGPASGGGGNTGGGNAGGGNTGGNTGGGSTGGGKTGGGSTSGGTTETPKGDFGKTCTKNSDCSDVCLFKGSADYGYCSKSCESFTECPTFWMCEEVMNASGKYCIQN